MKQGDIIDGTITPCFAEDKKREHPIGFVVKGKNKWHVLTPLATFEAKTKKNALEKLELFYKKHRRGVLAGS